MALISGESFDLLMGILEEEELMDAIYNNEINEVAEEVCFQHYLSLFHCLSA